MVIYVWVLYFIQILLYMYMVLELENTVTLTSTHQYIHRIINYRLASECTSPMRQYVQGPYQLCEFIPFIYRRPLRSLLDDLLQEK